MKKLEEVLVDIEELKRLEEVATEGPWNQFADRIYHNHNENLIQVRDEACWFINCQDADFIVATRNALPSLIKELEVLRESVKRFEGMEISNFEETMEDYKGLNAVNNLWKHKRDIISAWVKEQLGEV